MNALPEKASLLAIARTINLTPTRFEKLRDCFGGSWEQAWKATGAQMRHAGLDTRAVEQWEAKKQITTPEQEWEALSRCGASMLVRGEGDFPEQLVNIPAPPSFVLVRGEIKETDFPSLAVVGSRHLGVYGKKIGEHFLPIFARAGIPIVSGFAYGADILAHKTAHRAGARTIAVLGSGIDCIYPGAHQAFARQLITEGSGVIISEYLPGVQPRPENFPVRNRIIAGLAKVVLVLQAGDKSGSLITARIANEQGKDIFAVPGDIFSSWCEGCNRLIARGEANALITPEQILTLFGKEGRSVDTPIENPEGEAEVQIMEAFTKQSEWAMDDLVRGLPFDIGQVSSALLMLEMKGLIKNVGGGTYVCVQ